MDMAARFAAWRADAAHWLIALLGLAVLSGCAGGMLRSDETQDREVAGLLAGYRRAAALPAEGQRRELAAARLAYERAPDDKARLGLALTLLLPHAVPRDEAGLRTLLNGVAAGESSARYDLAQTLLALVAERQRSQEQLSHVLREERRRSEEMQQKIESLRAIEKDLRSHRNSR